jgi:hypothetical protein
MRSLARYFLKMDLGGIGEIISCKLIVRKFGINMLRYVHNMATILISDFSFSTNMGITFIYDILL